jgi:hypothetical protein
MIAIRAGLDNTPLALVCVYRQANLVPLEVRGALNLGYRNGWESETTSKWGPCQQECPQPPSAGAQSSWWSP